MTATQPELLHEDERERRLALIKAALPTYVRLRDQALHDYRRVERWSLPPEWDPGRTPDQDPDAPTTTAGVLLGLPVTFDAAPGRIVAHLFAFEGETYDWCGQCAQPLRNGRHPAGSLCPRRTLADPNNTDRIEADA